jgi:putative flippase GtrA
MAEAEQVAGGTLGPGHAYLGATGLTTPSHGSIKDAFRKFFSESWKYLLASAAALAVDYSLLVFLTETERLHYLAASCFSYSIGAIAHYAICVRWVFDARRLTDRRVEFASFVSIGFLGLAVTQVLLWSSVEVIGISYLSGKIIATGFSFILNFVARKLLLFTAWGQKNS